MINISTVEEKLKKAWFAETSYYADSWNSENPAFGQCAVTALVLNDYFGGDIVWAEVALPDGKKESHYFNVINGKELDLTRSQFGKDVVVPVGVPKTKGFSSTREFMLSSADTKRRYEILKKIIEKQLQE